METSRLNLIATEIKALQQELHIERSHRKTQENLLRLLQYKLQQETTQRQQLSAEINRLWRVVDGTDSTCEDIMTIQDQVHEEVTPGGSCPHSSTPKSDSINFSDISPRNSFGANYIPTVRPAPTKRPNRPGNEEKRRRTEGDAKSADMSVEEIPQPASLPILSTGTAGRSVKESAGMKLLRIYESFPESNTRGSSSDDSCSEESDGLNASTKLVNTYMKVQDGKESDPLVENKAKLREAVMQTLDDWQPKKPSIKAKKMALAMEMCSTTTTYHFEISQIYSMGQHSPWPMIIRKVFNDLSEQEQKELMKHVTLSARQGAKSYFGTLVDLLVQTHAEHCPQCKPVSADPL